jgi:hypothetical protein
VKAATTRERSIDGCCSAGGGDTRHDAAWEAAARRSAIGNPQERR